MWIIFWVLKDFKRYLPESSSEDLSSQQDMFNASTKESDKKKKEHSPALFIRAGDRRYMWIKGTCKGRVTRTIHIHTFLHIHTSQTFFFQHFSWKHFFKKKSAKKWIKFIFQNPLVVLSNLQRPRTLLSDNGWIRSFEHDTHNLDPSMSVIRHI